MFLVVDDARRFHLENMEVNRDHYPWGLRLLLRGSGRIQESGAGVTYLHAHSPHFGRVKYGVVSRATFLRDLQEWDTFYIAGRLCKPVHIVRDGSGGEVVAARERTLTSALALAALQLRGPDSLRSVAAGDTNEARKLFMTVAGLSYLGDTRMALGAEDPKKIEKLVDGKLPDYVSLYGKALSTCCASSDLLETASACIKELPSKQETDSEILRYLSKRNASMSISMTAKGLVSVPVLCNGLVFQY